MKYEAKPVDLDSMVQLSTASCPILKHPLTAPLSRGPFELFPSQIRKHQNSQSKHRPFRDPFRQHALDCEYFFDPKLLLYKDTAKYSTVGFRRTITALTCLFRFEVGKLRCCACRQPLAGAQAPGLDFNHLRAHGGKGRDSGFGGFRSGGF